WAWRGAGTLGGKKERRPVVPLVGQLPRRAVQLEHEPLPGAVVADRRRLLAVGHGPSNAARCLQLPPTTPPGSGGASPHGGAGPSGDRTRTSPLRNTDTGPSELTAITLADGSSKLYRRPAV